MTEEKSKSTDKLSHWIVLSLIFVIWAGLYLPSLTTNDIDRNEARRILPACNMLESGNWSTPQLASTQFIVDIQFLSLVRRQVLLFTLETFY